MKLFKRCIYYMLLILSIFLCTSCIGKQRVASITIVYTNDMHGYVANEGQKLRINNIKAYVEKLKAQGKNVLLVDAGDHVQGSAYSAYDKGYSAIDIMNAAQYDLAIIGNHEFDYGMNVFYENVVHADFDYLSCNFKKNGKRVLKDSKIFEFNGIKIGFVGVSTPLTISSSTPAYFKNEYGEYIYSFDGEKNPNDLYQSFQDSVDNIKDKCDVVIGLGHLGVGIDETQAHLSSRDLIKNTSGINAFIDGHSHTKIEKEVVKNKNENDIILTQTGSYIEGVGVMEVYSSGDITSKIITSYDVECDDVKKIEDSLITKVEQKLGQTIAASPVDLDINDSNGNRVVRAMETNLADLTADSVYWYFNDKMDLNCDVAIINGGGVRSKVSSGDITYLSMKNVQPFSNVVCLIKATGQQLKDALEMGAAMVGIWDNIWNSPAENGGFLHVAGMKYQIDGSIPSTIVKNGDDFVSSPSVYKVSNLMIYNKDTQNYEDIDLQKEYTIGGINYILTNGGNGMTMFNDSKTVVDFVGEDYMIASEYIQAFNKVNNIPTITSFNSPLSKYNNYLINYENPMGSGRINIVNINYSK